MKQKVKGWQLPRIEPRTPGFKISSVLYHSALTTRQPLAPNNSHVYCTLNDTVQQSLSICCQHFVLVSTTNFSSSEFVASGGCIYHMLRCPGFKFHATAAVLLFCLITLKSQYSNHTCITLGIIVSCSGIGETDATLKVVSAQVLSTGHRTINTVVSCSK